MLYYDYIDCLSWVGKFQLIKDSNFSPLSQIQSYLDPSPITTLKRPLDLCIGALNFCWLLDEEQAIESKISRELRELTLNTWKLEWYTLPRVQCSILCSLLPWAIFFLQVICIVFCDLNYWNPVHICLEELIYF